MGKDKDVRRFSGSASRLDQIQFGSDKDLGDRFKDRCSICGGYHKTSDH